MPPIVTKVTKSDKEKQFQSQLLLEKELAKLRHEYFTLDAEQTRHILTGYPKLTKINKIINIFENEYKNILTDLAVATSHGNILKDQRQFDCLQDLIQDHDDKTQSVKSVKQQMKELDSQIVETRKSLQAWEKEEITDYQWEHYVHSAVQTLETVENQLETQMKKFNVIVAENFKLRLEVNHLLWDRKNFMTAWKKLIGQLNSGKHIMLDLIQQATIAYDQREEWCNKLQLLRTTGHKDFQANTDKMRSYNLRLDDGVKLEEFFNTKGQKRVMRDLYRKETIKRKEHEKKIEEKLQDYINMLHNIQTFTKQEQVDIIAKNYYNREADNFSKFKYVMDLIKEMELVDDYLTSLHYNIEEHKILLNTRTNQQRSALEHLEEEAKAKEEETKEVEDAINESTTILKDMMEGIWKMFTICKCDQDPLLRLLGNNTKITEYNILLYLQMLEQTIHRNLIKAAYRIKTPGERKLQQRVFTDEKIVEKLYPIEKIVPATPCSLCVAHEMVSDVIDRVQHPLTRAEALEKLKQRLQLPQGDVIVHTLSKCHLPAARHIIQKAYE